MNVKATNEFFESNNIVAMRAYKSDLSPQVDRELVKLGNNLKAIPFYAVYGPGIDEPVTFSGVVTAEGVRSEIQKVLNASKAESPQAMR